MELVIALALWLGLSILAGHFAEKRGREKALWIMFALVLSPILALAILAVLPDLTPQEPLRLRIAIDEPPGNSTMECPRCAETIKRAAKICRFCGFELGPAPNGERSATVT
ncbi:hypothetical protein KIO73_05300 [Chelatococcus asaccharovorans]|nr:hypothetical protein [Chelatococcus asaccharovorans]